MAERIAYAGQKFVIEYAELPDHSMPAREFVDGLERQWQARLYVLFQKLGEFGRIHNQEQFKKLEGEIWEFKAHQVRLLCCFAGWRLVILTHGFMKKSQRTPPAELERARRIKDSCLNLKV